MLCYFCCLFPIQKGIIIRFDHFLLVLNSPFLLMAQWFLLLYLNTFHKRMDISTLSFVFFWLKRFWMKGFKFIYPYQPNALSRLIPPLYQITSFNLIRNPAFFNIFSEVACKTNFYSNSHFESSYIGNKKTSEKLGRFSYSTVTTPFFNIILA